MKKEKKRTFESETLILPPLRMVLSDNEQRKPPVRKKRLLSPEEQAKEDALWKLIERLEKKN
jgi:hypothetical protein